LLVRYQATEITQDTEKPQTGTLARDEGGASITNSNH